MLRLITAIAWAGMLGMSLGIAPVAQADDTRTANEPANEQHATDGELDGVTVLGRVLTPTELVAQRVIDAAELANEVPLHYTYVKRYLRESLRGRPVIFAAWSERSQTWHMVEIEVPFPAPLWSPGKRLAFRVLTPGYTAKHVRGVGAERLLFDIFHDEEQLQVYGRKYPMIDMQLVKKQGVRNAVASAEATLYLPLTDDIALLFVLQGHSLLRSTAESALRELRENQVPSFAYRGKLLADTVLPETLMSLAVIEQTDDRDFKVAPTDALNKTVGHYGVMQYQAFTYSVSRANATGPMQFTDTRGRGTYSMVVRRCAEADLSPDFDSGARDLSNAMKAAACLLDLNNADMTRDVRSEYSQSPGPLSIFAVAAYNGGSRNAVKLLRAVRRFKDGLAALRIPDVAAFESLKTRCPCLWMNRGGQTTSMVIPAYNRENAGYVDKYLRFMSMMQSTALR